MYNKKIPIDINCGFRIAIEVMGGKWKPYIIYELLDSAKRPSEIQRRMPEAKSAPFMARVARQMFSAWSYCQRFRMVPPNVAKPLKPFRIWPPIPMLFTLTEAAFIRELALG